MSEPDHIFADHEAGNSQGWENQAFLNSVIENIPLMIFVKEAVNLRFVRWNKAGEKIVGLSNAELIGKSDFDFFPKNQAEFFTRKDREVLESGRPADIPEEPVNTPRGIRYLHTRKIPILDAAGRPQFLLGISEDITERKTTEEAAGRLQAIMEAASDLIGISGPNGKMDYLNTAGRRMLGIGATQDLSGRRFQEFHPAWAVRMIEQEAIPKVIRDGHWSGETTMVTSSGVEFPVSQVITAHRDRDGNIQYMSTIVRDISEMKKLHAEVVQSKKMEAAATLAAGTAHEFNNLHTAILMAAELIKDQAGGNKEILECVADIFAASERASGLTRRLLAFARQDRFSHPTSTNLNILVQKEHANLQAMLGRDVELVYELDPNLDEVNIDPSDFDQILFCLAENAHDAMPSGGKVVLRTANTILNAPGQGEQITAGRYVQLSFTDTGCGMDAITKARIFEPFFTTKGRASGTGLGLAALYGIVRRQGGVVQFRSDVGHGTSFDILLPSICRVDESAENAAAKNSPPPAGRNQTARATVLLVDDEAPIRRVMRRQLEKNGFLVIETGMPEEALTIAREKAGSIDILVSDLLMPQMDGRKLAEHVLAISPNIKVLFMSGYSEEDVPGGPLVMSHPFLAKPCSGVELVEKVRETLSQPSDARS